MKKRTKKIFLVLYLLIMLGYGTSLVFLTKSLLLLNGVETKLRVLALIVFYILFLLYFIGGFLSIAGKKKKTFIIISIIIFLFIPIFSVGSYYINKTFSSIERVNKKEVSYTSNLIALKDTKITNSKDITIGMIENEDDIEGNKLAMEIIKKEELDNTEIKLYSDYQTMLKDLYDKNIDGLFASANYISMFSTEEEFPTLEDDTYVVYKLTKKMVNQDIKSSGKSLNEPFSMLIIGIDSTEEKMSTSGGYRSDTMMLITFNPHTLNATMLGIPRDTTMKLACADWTTKINASANYGTNCVVKTVEKLTGVNVDYYVKVNFKGVVNLVDALGGVTVNVAEPTYGEYKGTGKLCEQDSKRRTGSDLICMSTGESILNGEQALAYARNRHAYLLSDYDRVQHQQDVVAAAAKRITSIKSIKQFYSVLDAITNNIDTNMTTGKMLTFYSVMKDMLDNSINNEEFITIDRTYLSLGEGYRYYTSSINEITDLMKVNLELKEPTLIKTINFSINTPYEVHIYGKETSGGLSGTPTKTTTSTTSKTTTTIKNTTETKSEDMTNNEPENNKVEVVDEPINNNIDPEPNIEDGSTNTNTTNQNEPN